MDTLTITTQWILLITTMECAPNQSDVSCEKSEHYLKIDSVDLPHSLVSVLILYYLYHFHLW